MLNFLVWNIRGIANLPSQRRLKKLIKVHNIDCVAIIEPKIRVGTAKDFEFKLNCNNSFSDVEGNIWVFWKNNVKATLIKCTSQYIYLTLEIGGIDTDIFIIHASCNSSHRQTL